MRTIKNRDEFCRAVEAVPLWKKWVICLILERKKRRAANAYARAAVHDLYYFGGHLFEELRDRSDVLFAEIYGIEL